FENGAGHERQGITEQDRNYLVERNGARLAGGIEPIGLVREPQPNDAMIENARARQKGVERRTVIGGDQRGHGVQPAKLRERRVKPGGLLAIAVSGRPNLIDLARNKTALTKRQR